MQLVIAPFPSFYDLDGSPLEGGTIFIGETGQNPVTHPVALFYDAGATQPCANPVSTSGGYMTQNGSPARVYVTGDDFSILVYNSSLQTVYNASSANGVEDLRAELAAAGGSNMIGFLQGGVGAIARKVQEELRDHVKAFQFLTDNERAQVLAGSFTDDLTASVQKAITYAAGRPVYMQYGAWRIAGPLELAPVSYDGVFGPASKLFGDGIDRTIIDHRGNGVLFNINTDASVGQFKGALGGYVADMSIVRNTTTTGGIAINVTSQYNLTLHRLRIKGMSQDGIVLPTILGDNDASNMTAMEQVRIEDCARWGIKADGDSGHNELSYLHMKQVFIQNCGTTDAAYQPSSGGLIWKGQIGKLDLVAFTLNKNCAMFVPGQAGLANSLEIVNTTFENNLKRGFFTRGIRGLKMRGVQFYNNDGFVSTNGFEAEADSFLVEGIDIDGAVVRATSGNNAYTAFKVSGANLVKNSTSIKNVIWDNFDYAGQTRFSGVEFPTVENHTIIVVSSSTEVALRPDTFNHQGASVPLRLRGPNNSGGVGVASTSGEWIENHIASAGVAIPLASVLASTRYYCYLYDNDGLPTIEPSTTAFVVDSVTGYAVKTGDATKFYIGSIMGGGSNATVATTALGWLDPVWIPGTQSGAPCAIWADSSGRLRITASGVVPSSDSSGVVVGTQS